ncbi:MAG TPA: hypothetical protein VMH30_06850 [Verrucomicrobiae bacterium]|nr:hypothetical protein [Verrucomicrobiae bacterium]
MSTPLSLSTKRYNIVVFCTTIAVIGLTVCGCSPSMNDYKDTVRDGIKTLPHVREMKQMFPNAPMDNFITQYGFDEHVPVAWNTVTYIYGRYELGYQVGVIVDYKNNRISKIVSEPTFYLLEIQKVSAPTSDGVVATSYSSERVIHEKDWKKVVAAKGDFSVIGINLITNSPIAGFDDYVHGKRKDIVQVDP